MLGDMSVAGDYRTYLENSVAIDFLIASDSQSIFAAGWLVTLARATEIGLNRRAATDFVGGYTTFLDEKADGVIGGGALGAGQVEMADPISGLRTRQPPDPTGGALSAILDTIEIGSQTVIKGGAGNDQIRLAGDQLLATGGGVNAGLTVNGVAFNGQARLIDVAATVYAGAGDDNVQASDRGDNLFGEDGNDALWRAAGRLADRRGGGRRARRRRGQRRRLGGDGNYLEGGIERHPARPRRVGLAGGRRRGRSADRRGRRRRAGRRAGRATACWAARAPTST